VNALALARWQFGIITVYHFLFVPLTLGLSVLVAGLQTAWVRTGKEHYLRATKFWGKLFLINFAMGVVTGIVQEFQFGMNWSTYSRFVGDIFGAPLAIEGLLAFFLESTFLGLWIFGWDKLPKKVHLTTIWLAAIGTWLSAYFILAANSWMQHPVGYAVNEAANRAELKDFPAVLGNSTVLATFPHTIAAGLFTAGVFIMAISAWHVRKANQLEVFRPSIRLGMTVTLLALLAVMVTGDIQARVMTKQQPMKMAAAEALYNTKSDASFSIFTIGSLDGSREVFSIRIPDVLSIMATGKPSGTVEGIDDLQITEAAKYGPGDYKPNVPIAYWSFRLMIGFGVLAGLIAAWGLWLFRRSRTPKAKWFYRAAIFSIVTPYLANSFGWIFTEMARQPWVVYGVLKTSDGVSVVVGAATVLTSLVTLSLLYGVLAVIEIGLLVRYIKAGAPEVAPESHDDDTPADERPLTFAY